MPLEPHELENTEMTYSQALIIPVSSSVCLLILFFYFAYAQYLLMGLIVLVGACALFQLLNIAVRQLCTKLNDQVILGLSLCMTIVAVIDWVSTGSIIIHNLLGCALCTVFISTLRFPSLKIATLCLTLLVVYDIFWVFCSEYFFSKNVMVEVATKVASNPLYEAGQQLHIDMAKYVTPTIELPIKLMFPNYETGRMVMLGLGDIALPGALVAFALRCDMDFVRERTGADGTEKEDVEVGKRATGRVEVGTAAAAPPVTVLFNFALAGYFFGLIAAFVGNTWSGLPQPALIYLVPGVLLTVIGKAWQMGQLKNVWLGPSKGDSTV
jgi:hypothetical protein